MKSSRRMKLGHAVLLVLSISIFSGTVMVLLWPSRSAPPPPDMTIADSGLPMFLQQQVDQISSDFARQIGAPRSDYEMMRRAADAAAHYQPE